MRGHEDLSVDHIFDGTCWIPPQDSGIICRRRKPSDFAILQAHPFLVDTEMLVVYCNLLLQEPGRDPQSVGSPNFFSARR